MIYLADSPTTADRVVVAARVVDRMAALSDDPDIAELVREVVDATLSVLDPADRSRRGSHSGWCVDDDGKIECVCGLDEAREESYDSWVEGLIAEGGAP